MTCVYVRHRSQCWLAQVYPQSASIYLPVLSRVSETAYSYCCVIPVTYFFCIPCLAVGSETAACPAHLPAEGMIQCLVGCRTPQHLSPKMKKMLRVIIGRRREKRFWHLFSPFLDTFFSLSRAYIFCSCSFVQFILSFDEYSELTAAS